MVFLQALAVICFAALVGLLIWSVTTSFFRRSIGGEKTVLTVIVTVEGSPAELEQSVKGLLWLIESNTLDSKTKIVIKNAGDSGETAKMAQILERDNEAVTVAK